MKDPNEMTPLELLAALDQSNKTVIDTMPPFWWGMFEGLRQQGFTTDQSMQLLITYIKAQMGAAQ